MWSPLPDTWRYRDTVLALAVVANFAQTGSRLVIGPLVPAIIGTFHVSKGALGLALTGAWGIYALLQFPSGAVADTVGERRIVIAALACVSVGSVLLALAPSFGVFAAFALFLGAGAGLYSAVATALLARLYATTGGPLGLHTTGGALAGLLAPVVAALVSVRYGWRPAILFGAAVALPALALFAARVCPERSGGAADALDALRERVDPVAVWAVLSRPRVAFTLAVGTAGIFTFQSFTTFFPTFLVEYRDYSTAGAGLVFGAVFAISLVGLPVFGNLSDRFSRDAVLAGSLLAAALGVSAFVVGEGWPATAAGVVLMGLGTSWGGVLQSRFMDGFADAERGASFGLVRSVYLLFGATGSVVTGVLADAAGWGVAFGLVAVLLGSAVVALTTNYVLGLGY